MIAMTRINHDRGAFIGFIAVFMLASLSLYASVVVKGSLTHERQAVIGSSYEDRIEIQNNGDKPEEVKIYQTDYLFYADGRYIYGDPGKIRRSNALWITFSPKLLTVPPKETLAVSYTVKVPADKGLIGTYWSIIMIEGIPEESPESSSASSKNVQLGIRELFRYALQVITNIGNTGTRSIKFLSTKLVKKDAQQYLEIDVENTGERGLRSQIRVELYDPDGNYSGKFGGKLFRIYPETSVRFRVDFDKVPANTYKALLVIDCGGADIFGANLNLIFK
jgi:hypothetical protein